MTINRVVHDKNNPYTLINTSIVFDTRVSGLAKALWLYAFSRPDDWQFYTTEMVKHFSEGRDAINTALKNLENAGYLERIQERLPNGQLGQVTWIWHEVFKKRVPETACADTAKALPLNPTLLNIDSKPNIEKQNNDENKAVVVPLCLKKIGIPEDLQIKLAKEYGDDPERIENACMAVSQMKPRNMEATIQDALRKAYKPSVQKEDVSASNKEWTERNLRKYDSKQVGPLRCDIMPEGVQYSGLNSAKPRFFSFEDVSFKDEITKMMNKLLKT